MFSSCFPSILIPLADPAQPLIIPPPTSSASWASTIHRHSSRRALVGRFSQKRVHPPLPPMVSKSDLCPPKIICLRLNNKHLQIFKEEWKAFFGTASSISWVSTPPVHWYLLELSLLLSSTIFSHTTLTAYQITYFSHFSHFSCFLQSPFQLRLAIIRSP